MQLIVTVTSPCKCRVKAKNERIDNMSKVTAKVRKPIDTQHITQLVRDIKEREQVKKQLEAEIKAAQEEIKQTMKANALEEMIADVFTIRYKPVVTSRFDTGKFKDKYRELYDSFCTPTESMKFTIT